jgi:site-specific DNA-methyltransferase (adenine-specific)
LAVAVEDAGFEIRDSIAWLYGSGFPKSLDVSKAIDRAAGELSPENKRFTVAGVVPGSDMLSTAPSAGYIPPQPATDAAKQWQGWGTALKPAFEPIVVARKPIHGTVATNVQVFGTGALNIDGCRVGTGGQLKWSTPRDMGYHGGSDSTGEATSNNLGRWPANLVLDGGQADELDRQSGALHKRGNVQASATAESSWFSGSGTSDVVNYDDLGGASRFFPVFRYEAKAPTTERPTANGTAHPTVKPLDLMRWLVRLVTPPHGVVLDPFAGSGTTAEACIHEHMRCITIEREADYLPLIVARLTKPLAVGFDFDFTEEQQQEVDSE